MKNIIISAAVLSLSLFTFAEEEWTLERFKSKDHDKLASYTLTLHKSLKVYEKGLAAKDDVINAQKDVIKALKRKIETTENYYLTVLMSQNVPVEKVPPEIQKKYADFLAAFKKKISDRKKSPQTP